MFIGSPAAIPCTVCPRVFVPVVPYSPTFVLCLQDWQTVLLELDQWLMSRKQLPLHTVGVVERLRDCHPTRQKPHAGMSATAHYAHLAYCSWHKLFNCYDKGDASMILPAHSDDEHVKTSQAESVTVPIFCHRPSETFRCVWCKSETRCSLHCRVWDVFERGIWGGKVVV